MKKYAFVLFVLFTIIFSCKNCYGIEIAADAMSFYDEVKEYDKSGILDGSDKQDKNSVSDLNYIVSRIINIFSSEVIASLKYLAIIIFLCILSSLLKSFVSKKEICDIGNFSCFCICVISVLSGFELISDICFEATKTIKDFMAFSLPAYASVVAECGFAVTATTMQSIFMFISVIISDLIVNFIYPLLYLCGLITSINGISSHINLSRFIKILSKTIKFSTGVIMTIFAGIITFAGFSSSAGDNIAIKTIKYTVSNFVPVVGACLSDTLNSIIGSSHVLKSNMGYIIFLGLISVCIIPVIKSSVSILVFRISSAAAELFMEDNISKMIDSVCDIMATMVSMLIFVISVFVLIIGIMASTG